MLGFTGPRRQVRAALLAAVLAAVAGCAQAPARATPSPDAAPSRQGGAVTPRPGPAVPFGGHRFPYAAGTLTPSAPRETLDRAVLASYTRWKKAFLKRNCGHGWYQVISPDADHPYVAEAQGYGMVILATMAGADPEARTAFDGMVAYMLAHPSVNDHDLLAAEQDSRCRSVNGSDSATDGDLDVAYALLLADRQWGSAGVHDYRSLAIRHIDAIKASEINPRTRLTRLGDWSTPEDPTYYVTRSSDWLLDRFRAFAKATGDPDWEEIRAAHQRLIAAQQSRYAPETGLLADFVVATDTAPRPAPGEVLEDAHDGAYYWNACRDPWRIGADAVTAGDPASRAAARTMSAWIRRATGGDPDRIAAGYTLKGAPIDEGQEPAFFAPFAVAAMSDPGAQAWLDALWAKMIRTPVVPSDYYAATVQLQVMIVVSGNSWTP